MGNTTAGANTICPFYKKESRQTICCESEHDAAPANVSSVLTFRSEEEKKAYQKDHCFQYKSQCEIAKGLYDKYEKETT